MIRANWALPALLLMLTGAGACHKQQPEEAKPPKAVMKYTPPTGSPPGSTTAAAPAAIAEELQREVDAAAHAHADAAARVKTVRPVVKCVEPSSSGQWQAHFGFTNSGSAAVPIPFSLFNRFWPPPMVRSQPKVFAAGSRDDVMQVPFDSRSSTAWVLGAGFALADANSARCPSRKVN